MGFHSGERLVEHDEFRIDGQTSRYLRATAFASRKLVAKILPDFLQAEFRYQALEFVALIFWSGIGHFQHGLDIVFHAEFAEHRRLLGKIAYTVLRPFIYREFGYIEIVEINLAFIRRYQSHGHIESRGLACTVR